MFIEQLDQFLVKDERDNQPTIYEVSRAIAQMNSQKAPGWNGINAELLKCGG